jgi:LuxR family transcriptional regulator, maltose regulon positive regulatory protein
VASIEIAYALLAQAEARRSRGAAGEAAALTAEARRVVERCGDPGILTEMLARAERALRAPARAPRAETDELTERELAVLRLLPGELSQRGIGEALYLSINTVKTYVRGIYRKLGVGTREEAVARGRERGLI